MSKEQNFRPGDYHKYAAARQAEYEAEKAAAKSALEAYWAGSASASVLRDYKAGRVVRRKCKA